MARKTEKHYCKGDVIYSYDDALRALIALKYRKSKWGFFTVFSFMQHIERYLKV